MSDIDPATGRRTATDPRPHVRMTADFFTSPGKLNHIADPVERMATLGLLGASIGMSRRLGSDGHIVPEAVLAETGLPPEYAKTLMTDGSWHQADHGCPRCPQPRLGCVYLHDILEHQRTAEQERRTAEHRRNNGAEGAAARWAGHVKKPKSGRRPGRPPKNPPTETTPAGQLALIPLQPGDTQQVLQHPAETRARSRAGRPARTEARIFDPVVVQLCEHFADWRARNDPDGKRPTVTERWLNACRLMIEVDGRDPENIRKAIDYSQGHEREQIYVKSIPKLRDQYAELQKKAKLEQKRATSQGYASRRATVPAAGAVPNMSSLYGRQVPPPARSGGGR